MKRPTTRRLWPFKKGGDPVSQPPGDAGNALASESGKNIAALEALLRDANPGTPVRVDEVFVSPRLTPIEHEWYYGAQCRRCHRTSAAIHDPNDGQTKLSFAGSGEIHFHCHHCNALLKVTATQLVWFKFDG